MQRNTLYQSFQRLAGQDCAPEVASSPKCADFSWTYCRNLTVAPKNYGFSCLDGWTCYSRFDGRGNEYGVDGGPPGFKLQPNQTLVPTIYVAYSGPGLGKGAPSESFSSKSSTGYTLPGNVKGHTSKSLKTTTPTRKRSFLRRGFDTVTTHA